MGAAYIRQASANIQPGLNIHSVDFNAEFNALQSAFSGSTGHAHDGTTGNGPKLDLTASTTGNLASSRGGMPTGGAANSFLMKNSATDFDAAWAMLSSHKDTIVNNEFSVWQRGAQGSAAVAIPASSIGFFADRWYAITPASCSFTFSQIATTGPADSRYCAVCTRDAGQTGGAGFFMGQPYTTDQLAPLRGKRILVTIKLASGAGFTPTSGQVSAAFYIGTGTEGKRPTTSFTGQTIVATSAINLGQSSGVRTLSFSSAGVVPTNATQGELDIIWSPVGTAPANDSLTLYQVSVEPYTDFPVFEHRPFAQELAMCQRFYQKSFPLNIAPGNSGTGAIVHGQYAGAGAVVRTQTYMFPVRMRASPAATLYNPSAANAQMRNSAIGADCTSTIISPNEMGFYLSYASAVGSSVANLNIVDATFDAEL